MELSVILYFVNSKKTATGGYIMHTVTTYRVKLSTEERRVVTEDEAKNLVTEERDRLLREGYHTLLDSVGYFEERNGYANMTLFTDVSPFEIVRVVSDLTIEVRAMDYELMNAGELEFHAGGFSAHCSNQHSQRYNYTQNPEAGVIRLRRRKDGNFYYKGTRFVLSEKPRRFYDYNF